MRCGATKSGAILALAAAMTVCGADEGSSTTFQFDRVAFEQIHTPAARQASRGWLAWPAPGEESAKPNSPNSSRLPSTHSVDAWRLANLAPISNRHSDLVRNVADVRLVRLRPSARRTDGRMGSIDAKIFTATPGGRPISDTYDFASLDPDSFAAIKPTKPKQPPIENIKTPKRKIPPPPNEVLDLGVKALSYIVLTTKLFVENLSRTLYNAH